MSNPPTNHNVRFQIGTRAVLLPLDRHPDVCPHCHCYGMPLLIPGMGQDSANIRYDEDRYGRRFVFAELVYRCPRIDCHRLFIATYHADPSGDGNQSFGLIDLSPRSAKNKQFSKHIENVAPQFAAIYNEALEAERRKLLHVCGPGFRKALEFLVKDYLINHKKIEADVVKPKFLGRCINDHLADTEIAECAKRAAWLGNDETHYVRHWKEKDLQDLKALINTTVSLIESAVRVHQLKVEMPELSKSKSLDSQGN